MPEYHAQLSHEQMSTKFCSDLFPNGILWQSHRHQSVGCPICVSIFLVGYSGRWLGLEVRELDVSPRYWFLIMDRSVNIFYFSYFSCVISPQLFIILWVRRSSWAVFLLYMGLLTWVHSDHDWDGQLKKTLLTGSVLLHHAFLSSQVVLSFGSLA